MRRNFPNMNQNFAFKLCGELCNTGINLAYAVSTGNTAMVCLNAGIELLDMTSSLISYSAERNRTKQMQSAYQENKLKYEKLRDATQKQAKIIITQEKNISQLRIERLKRDLINERNILMQKLEQASAELQSINEFTIRKSELASKLRIKVKDTIDVVSDFLEQFTKENPDDTLIIAELHEKLRVSVTQYTKFVSTCC